MIKPYFYKITNVITNKFYYGSGSKKLGINYFSSSKLVNESISKYGIENFNFEVLKEFNTREEAFAFEDRFLKLHKISINRQSYNLKDSGKGGWTTEHYSDKQMAEYKQRLSLGQKNRPAMTFETRRKISLKNQRRFMGDKENLSNKLKELWKDPSSIFNDPEYRQRLSECRIGHTVSEETREKIRVTKIGGLNPMAIKIKVDDIIYETRRDCANFFGISETAVTKRCKSKNFQNWEVYKN